MVLIGLSGCIGSGKDTVANYLCEHHHFIKFSWADALKDIVSVMFGWDRELVEGATQTSREFRETVDAWWSQKLGFEVTPRKMLQTIGTDVMRNHLHPEIWVAILERKLANYLRETPDINIVVCDCRFEQEVAAIHRLGGQVWRIVRGNIDTYVTELAKSAAKQSAIALARLQELNIHQSEWMVHTLAYDHLVKNSTTIPELYLAVNEYLNSEQTSKE